jgi:uncharacterized membrane protein YphA (DoxX/SURF4 family)
VSNPSLKSMALSTTTDKLLSFGLLLARVPIGMMLIHFLVGYAPGFGTHPTVPFALIICHVCAAFIMLGLFTKPAALLIILEIFLYNQWLFPKHGDPIHPWPEEFILYCGFYALMLFAGPGRYSLDGFFFNRDRKPQQPDNTTQSHAI